MASTSTPEDIAHIEGPILGYFGVVDERLDYDLIAKLADANSAWNVVMIGPTAKVDPQNYHNARICIGWEAALIRSYRPIPSVSTWRSCPSL
jgi:hypothetical protein